MILDTPARPRAGRGVLAAPRRSVRGAPVSRGAGACAPPGGSVEGDAVRPPAVHGSARGKSVKAWLRTLGGAAILGGLVWWQSTAAFTAAFAVIDGTAVVAALAIGLASTVFSAARWRLAAGRLGLRLSLGAAVADYYRALFLNAVLPAGVLGDVHRAVSHGRRAGQVAQGVRAVFFERLAGQVVLVAAGLAVLLTRPDLLGALAPAVVPAVIVLAAAAVALVCARRRVPAFAGARDVLAAWPGLIALSAGALAGHLALFVTAARLTGSAAPLADLVPLALLALLVMSLPVNIGGWGPREAVMAVAFGAAGLGSAQGLTISVVYGVLAFLSGLPGAAVLLVQRREAVPERADEMRERVPALAGRGQ